MPQIKNIQYTQVLEDYVDEILLVGINYDKDSTDKPHGCVIERLENHVKIKSENGVRKT